MGRYVAFLAGINVGRRRIKMDDLKAVFEGMGFSDVETILASGNVLFSSTLRTSGACESRIEKGLAESLGYNVNTYVRSPDEMRQVLEGSPFPVDEEKSDSSIHVLFFREPVSANVAKALRGIHSEVDRFGSRDREIYWNVKGRMSDSKIWESPEMKSLKLPSNTARNMNTVVKVVRHRSFA